MTVLPMLTWPSPAIATLPLRRTETMVVPRNCSMDRSLVTLIFFSCPRVGLVVYLGQMLEIKVRINLRGGYIGMPQQLLDTP